VKTKILFDHSVKVLLALGGVALAIASCGGSNSSGGTGGNGGSTSSTQAASSTVAHAVSSSSTGGPITCSKTTEITLAAFKASSADGAAASYRATSTPNLGDTTADDRVTVEFYGSAFDASLDGELTGTFDLAMVGDDNYATCSRCIRGLTDAAMPSKVFFQKSGKLVVDATSDQVNGTVKATLMDVTLIEVTIDMNTFESTPVDNPECLHIASAAVDAVKAPTPTAWTCDPGYYDDGDCDCGCGVVDIDCADAKVGSCTFCDDTGSCSADSCPGMIDPANNAVCTAPDGGAPDSGADAGDGGP
jgi:hypothetical protein